MKALNLACTIRNEVKNSMSDLTWGGTELCMSRADVDVEADRLWNDAGTMRDFIGDKIFESSNRRKTTEDKILCMDALV